MHETRNLFLFLIEINNNAPHQTHFTNTQDLSFGAGADGAVFRDIAPKPHVSTRSLDRPVDVITLRNAPGVPSTVRSSCRLLDRPPCACYSLERNRRVADGC